VGNSVVGSNKVLERIHDVADALAERAEASETLGRLGDETVDLMREVGVIRMLQPTPWGGMQAHPCEFFEAVMTLGSLCGSTGWVSGVVGVHPWEVGLFDPRVGEEIWGQDPDTWIASPYAPMGRARRVGDGWEVTGRWEFSSGTDHCSWVFLGALAVDERAPAGGPPTVLHVLLPRSDYRIIEDSWNVYGLKGTGSKDVVVEGAFVPAYRAVSAEAVTNGQAARDRGCTDPLYLMPWSTIFPVAITSAVIGICEGGLAACLQHQSGRAKIPVEALGAMGESASEIAACRTQLLTSVATIYDLVATGKDVPLQLRADMRRDQVRCSWRAVAALDSAFARSGGGGIRMGTPMQRFWRDAHAGLHHAINVPGPTYRTSVQTALGTVPASDAFI
jgi:3-hydroxy-9,10-secoandrosta-1,3,5(10)-triene-9,17-dione monooxygenase